MPKGVYLPVFGVTFGDGTTPEGTKVLQVTKAYDGVADSFAYIFNIASDLNAVLGFYYLHPGYYKNVDPDPNDPTSIATSADGNIADKLIPAPLGQLPLTMPLLALGVPPSLVTGDLLRSLFQPKPKPKPVTEPNGSAPGADPTPWTDSHEPARDSESGSAA